VAIWLSGGDNGTAEATDPGCNGSVLLCDRPFDEVVLAASHNSHAASNDGFVLGYQTVSIVPQLEEGIRGLLIDVYFGLQVGDGPVVTDRAPITAAEREQLVAEVGESAVRSAEATVERTAQLGGDRGLYLCHAFCEIGARPFVSEMVAVREFLEEHPREVIVMIIQDEGPTPADIAAAFDEAGLDQLVHTQQPGEPWPTLGEMIDADSRVFVSAENQSGRFDWYHDAFTSVQDTPFDYETVESFDCARNRGAPESPLLLVNHWLNPVSPRAADEANSAQVLLERVDECRADGRGKPNLIAVDFQDRGDLLQVVNGLNDL
jgi:hypothetical protein